MSNNISCDNTCNYEISKAVFVLNYCKLLTKKQNKKHALDKNVSHLIRSAVKFNK